MLLSNHQKFLSFAALLLSFFCSLQKATAGEPKETLRFISGEIYGIHLKKSNSRAESFEKSYNKRFSKIKSLLEYNKATQPVRIHRNNKYYLSVFVKLDPNRKLSLFDYSISNSNGKYDCLAITSKGKSFPLYDPREAGNNNWLISKSPQTIYQMLFIVDERSQLKPNQLAEYKLHYNLHQPQIFSKIYAQNVSKATKPPSLAGPGRYKRP